MASMNSPLVGEPSAGSTHERPLPPVPGEEPIKRDPTPGSVNRARIKQNGRPTGGNASVRTKTSIRSKAELVKQTVRRIASKLKMDDHVNGKKTADEAATNGVKTPEPEKPSTLQQLLNGVSDSAQQMRTLLNAIKAPVPNQTGDGSQLPQPQKENLMRDVNNLFKDIKNQDAKDLDGLLKTFKKSALKEPLDDREYLMESLVAVASKMPAAKLQKTITNQFVTTLWNDLEHPPQTLLSDKYLFRQPDGSHNNYKYPDIGKAGMPYARTVAPKTKQAACLPDPGVLFDALMARQNPKGTKHPNSISSMLFYLASIIIHDVFRTDHNDFNLSATSSYLDLAPLYGSTWEEQKRMRTFKDGKLKPDCFSESRLLTFPPGVGALLICFNRYHNYVVEQLAAINEDGRFTTDPRKPTIDRYGEKDLDKREDDLFQTGRLITTGLYVNIILIDYVRTILNLNRTDDNWQLNPRVEIPDGVPVGTGNQCSAEFNLVYRWHSAVSERDDLWTQELFRELFPGVSAEEVSRPDKIGMFLRKLKELADKTESQEPEQRPFPALKQEQERMHRIKEGPLKGNFEDKDLAELITSGIEDCSNAFGPRQVPTVMKAIEMLGIQQARTWKCATLNEMRKHFDLTPHETWEDITRDKDVQEALKHLYDTPDQVELYPGLVVEDAKAPKLPGSGLCPPFTTSRGVLSDAVALVRGDRFYTTSYTPALLTNWGFQEASSDLAIDNGCVFYKLFSRALPNSFDPASVYVHYPMTTPDEMKNILRLLEKDHMYNFEKPAEIKQPVVVFSRDAAVQVTKEQETFQVTWGPEMEFLMGSKAKDSVLAANASKNVDSGKVLEEQLYSGDEKWLKAVRDFYEQKTTELLKQKSYKLAGVSYVDIIRDVGNLAHVHFAAELWGIPLKTEDFPRGVFTEQQLYLVMAAVFISASFDLDPAQSFPLRQQARETTRTLAEILKLQTTSISTFGRLASLLLDVLSPASAPLKDHGIQLITQLSKSGAGTDDLVYAHILPAAANLVANQGQLFGQALDYFFTEGKEHLPAIFELSRRDTAEADDMLTRYLLEGVRLKGEGGVVRTLGREVTLTDTTQALGTKTYDLKVGDKVLVDLKAASRDPKTFPNPEKLDLTRPLESYDILRVSHLTRTALTTMLKVVGRLENLRPAMVSVGYRSVPHSVKKVVRQENGVPEEWCFSRYLTEDWDQYWPFPASLKINWDGNIPEAKRE